MVESKGLFQSNKDYSIICQIKKKYNGGKGRVCGTT